MLPLIFLEIGIQIDQNGMSKKEQATYLDDAHTNYNLTDFTGQNIMVDHRQHS